MTSIRRPRDHRRAVLAAGVGSAVASAYLALAGFFEAARNGPAVVLCVVVVAGVAIGSTAATLSSSSAAEKALAKRLTLRSALDAACLAFHSVTGEGTEKFGADLMLVDKRRWAATVLWTAVHGGFAQHPPTRIVWTAGKGIVGTSWQRGSTVFVDLERLMVGPEPTSEAGWAALDPDIRMGMSLDEWSRTRPYFGSIVAACIVDASREIVGIVAVYGPSGLDLTRYEPELRSATEALAATIGGLIE